MVDTFYKGVATYTKNELKKKKKKRFRSDKLTESSAF